MILEPIQEKNLNVTAYSNDLHHERNQTITEAINKKYATFIKLLLSSYVLIILLTVAIFMLTYKLVQGWTYRLNIIAGTQF